MHVARRVLARIIPESQQLVPLPIPLAVHENHLAREMRVIFRGEHHYGTPIGGRRLEEFLGRVGVQQLEEGQLLVRREGHHVHQGSPDHVRRRR